MSKKVIEKVDNRVKQSLGRKTTNMLFLYGLYAYVVEVQYLTLVIDPQVKCPVFRSILHTYYI